MSDLLPAPAVLQYPTWYGGPPDEMELPLPVQHYAVQHAGDRTIVSVIGTGDIVYSGIGPAEVVDRAASA